MDFINKLNKLIKQKDSTDLPAYPDVFYAVTGATITPLYTQEDIDEYADFWFTFEAAKAEGKRFIISI